MRRAFPCAAAILLIILVISAYCGTFYSPPILDDFHSFVYQEDVYLKDWSVSSLFLLSQTTFGWARWIPMISFSFDHWIGGGNVVFFHLTNALIHISCLIAVMFLVFNLLQAVGERETSPSVSLSDVCRAGCRGVGA